jgi:hypothetical protein
MDEQTIQTTLDYIDKLSLKLGEQVWPHFIRQQYIKVFWPVLGFFTIFLILFFLARFTARHWEPDDKDKYSITKSGHETLFIIPIIVISAFFVASMLESLIKIPILFNPEYHVIMDLISGYR